MDSASRVSRRHVLGLVAGAVVPRAARGARPSQLPRTLEGCVASMETLISLEAIDKVAELTEARQFQYRRGFDDIRMARWEAWSDGVLDAECVRAGFEPDELTDYLVSTMAWRRRGRPLDVAAQLAPFREARRREQERAREAAEANRRAGVRVFTCHAGILNYFDHLYFGRDAATPSPGQEKLMDAIAQLLVGMPTLAHVEVQAHAAPGERSPGDLSRERAVGVVEALVYRGVSAERLTAHGLSTRFPARRPGNKPKDIAADAAARADLFALRWIAA